MSGNYHETWAYRLTKFLHNRATSRSFETFSQFLLDRDYRNSFLSCGLIFLRVNAFFLEARNLRGISFGIFFFFLRREKALEWFLKFFKFSLWYCWVMLVKKLFRKFWSYIILIFFFFYVFFDDGLIFVNYFTFLLRYVAPI